MIKTIAICVVLCLGATCAEAVSIAGTQREIYAARDKVLPALVHIQPVIQNFQTGELEKQAVIGSGVIFDKTGHVLTNYHVAGKAVRIFCTLADKEVVPATFVGGDPATDLAVIKLDLKEYGGGPLSVAQFGNSDSLEVGEFVLAMGSPLALSRSVSAGVVSTKDRYFDTDVRLPSGEQTGIYNLWIQTDAAINPGNSGGPLVNLRGEVVGINSRATLFANNIGFAIPINIARTVSKEILKSGAVIRSYIGVQGQALQELEDHFSADKNRGVLVASVDDGSPAQEAGIIAGDIILAINGTAVSARFAEEMPAFYRMVAAFEPGTPLAIDLMRDNAAQTLNVTTRKLGELQGEDFEAGGWGFTVKRITEQMRVNEQLKDTTGVFVTGVKRSSPAFESGLRRGDIIRLLADSTVDHYSDFTALYEKLVEQKTSKILLTLDRRGATRYALINLSAKGSRAEGDE